LTYETQNWSFNPGAGFSQESGIQTFEEMPTGMGKTRDHYGQWHRLQVGNKSGNWGIGQFYNPRAGIHFLEGEGPMAGHKGH